MAMEEVPAQGAATSGYAALSQDWDGKRGLFLSNCAVVNSYRSKPPTNVDDTDVNDEGYLPQAYDMACEGDCGRTR